MASTRVFVSFDYDHDSDLKVMLLGQSKLPDSPFEITDVSITVATPGWKEVARRRIKGADVVAVICGQHTNTATGVAAEVKIAQEEGKPYFLLEGRANKNCTRPTTARTSDKMYDWTWENLKKLIGGSR
jgi:hypothetical protein